MDWNKRERLFEGTLENGDMRHLILNKISVDEFPAKVEEDAIVIGVYCKDEKAKNDLKDFFSTNHSEFLDVDASETKNVFSCYEIYIEVERNKKFVDIFMDLVEDLANLTDQDDWYFMAHGMKKFVSVSKQNLLKTVKMEAK